MAKLLQIDHLLDRQPSQLSGGQRQPADLTVTPVMIENIGSESYITFELGGAPMTAKVPGRMEEDAVAPQIEHRSAADGIEFCQVARRGAAAWRPGGCGLVGHLVRINLPARVIRSV